MSNKCFECRVLRDSRFEMEKRGDCMTSGFVVELCKVHEAVHDINGNPFDPSVSFEDQLSAIFAMAHGKNELSPNWKLMVGFLLGSVARLKDENEAMKEERKNDSRV